MMSTMTPLRYHGPGYELDNSPEWDVMVWLPNERRDDWSVSWEADWRLDGDEDDQGEPTGDWTQADFQKFDTADAMLAYLSTLPADLSKLVQALPR